MLYLKFSSRLMEIQGSKYSPKPLNLNDQRQGQPPKESVPKVTFSTECEVAQFYGLLLI